MKQVDDTTKARREYYQKWREKNRDRIRSYNRKYWIKRAEKAAAESKEAKSDDDNSQTGN